MIIKLIEAMKINKIKGYKILKWKNDTNNNAK